MVKPVKFRDRPKLNDIQSGDRFPVSRSENGIAITYSVDYDVLIREVIEAVTENRRELTTLVQQQQADLRAAVQALNTQAGMIEQTDAAMAQATSGLSDRIASVEAAQTQAEQTLAPFKTDIQQRMTAVEDAQSKAATAATASAQSQNALATRVGVLETSQGVQDASIASAKSRLDGHDTAFVSNALKNTTQDQRLTDLETFKAATVNKLSDLTNAIAAINEALGGKPSLVDLGTITVTQTALGAIIASGARTVELTGVPKLLKDDKCLLFILPTTANPNGVPQGYTVAAHPVAKANGTLEVQVVAPALALLASYSISCRLFAMR